MSVHVTSICGLVRAVVTLERLALVDLAVPGERGLIGEFLWAGVAQKWLVYCMHIHVDLEVSLLYECHITQTASVGSFACVNGDVLVQLAGLREPLLAYGTLIWPLPGMLK